MVAGILFAFVKMSRAFLRAISLMYSISFFIAEFLLSSSHSWFLPCDLFFFYIHMWLPISKAFSKRKFMGKELKDWAKEYLWNDLYFPYWKRVGPECLDGDNALLYFFIVYIVIICRFCRFRILCIHGSVIPLMLIPPLNYSVGVVFITWIWSEFDNSVNL